MSQQSAVALTAQAVADIVGGRLLGNGASVINAVAPLDRAGPGTLSYAVSSAYRQALRDTGAAVVLVTDKMADLAQRCSAAVVVEDPARAFAQVVERLFPGRREAPGIDPTARLGRDTVVGRNVSIGPWVLIGSGVRLGDECRIGPGTVIEDGVEVGSGSTLHANVVVYAGVTLGQRVRIKAGSVLGGEGFGFLRGPERHERVPQVGGLVIGDDVEIGSNCTVDRGSVGDTVIGRGTKIDNIVHVGHNARIGAHCLLAGGTLIAGSATLGDFVICGGASGVIDHVTVGDHVRIGVASPVVRNTPAGANVSGFPAHTHRETLRTQAAMFRLPAIIADLERMVEERRRG